LDTELYKGLSSDRKEEKVATVFSYFRTPHKHFGYSSMSNQLISNASSHRPNSIEPEMVLISEIGHSSSIPTSTLSRGLLGSSAAMITDDENDTNTSCFDPEDFSNTTDLCNEYRKVLHAHMSLHSSIIHEYCSCCPDDEGDTEKEFHCDDDLCLCDSLDGSFLSDEDSVKMLRQRRTRSKDRGSTYENLAEMYDLIEEELDEDDDDVMDSSDENTFVFDLTCLKTNQE